MVKIPGNPLKWFKSKNVVVTPPAQRPEISTKRVIHPKKSGNIFMHLITLQKSLQSLELALRQEIDYTWLLQKAKSVVSALKLEAEVVGEEDLVEGAGQLLAYLDSVLDAKLELNEEGIATLLDFVTIFKDALGDAVPGIKKLNKKQLEQWDTKYQALMAHMKPVEEEIVLADDVVRPQKDDLEPAQPQIEQIADATEAPPETEELLIERTTVSDMAPVVEEAPVDLPTNGDVREMTDAPADETTADDIAAIEGDDEEIPLCDEAEEPAVQDIMISDAETKSARELLESHIAGSSIPTTGDILANSRRFDPSGLRTGRNGDSNGKSPVQLEEVERLKKKLLELHEKQEMLSSKMSGILGDLKKVVRVDQKEREPVSVEKLDVDELEELIFIGRKKG